MGLTDAEKLEKRAKELKRKLKGLPPKKKKKKVVTEEEESPSKKDEEDDQEETSTICHIDRI